MTTQTIPAPTRKRILVVDDERFFREAIRDLLAEDGLECMVAATAAEALEAAQDPAVGVVVLDIQLPDQSGLAVLRLLRQQRPALRVVMLSAHTDQEYVLEALRQGACDYLAKPLHEEEVRLSVRRALDTYEMASGWESLRGRVGHLATELESLAAAGAGGEGEGIAGRAAEAVARLLDAGKTSVLLRDDRGDCLRVVATTGRKLAAGELGPVPLGEGVAGRAVAQGELIVVDDVERDPRFAPAPPERYESGSFVVLPLGSGPDRFGALCATDRSDGARFADEDVALLRLLALAVSPWLDPSRPLPGREAVGAAAGTPGGADAAPPAEGPSAELARLVCDAMTREVEPPRVLGSALRAIAECLGAAPVSVYLLDPSADRLVREAQWEADGPGDREALPRGTGLTGAAFESGQPIACAAPDADPRFASSTDTPETGAAGPLLVLPLRFRGRTLGVCRLFTLDPRAASPRIAEVLGAALSAAVRNVLLYRSLVESIEEVANARREGAPPGAGHP
jgi:FixJ family two-component response regulator